MQRHLLTGGGRDILLEYPESWDELSRKQAIFIGRLLHMLATKELEVDQFRKLVLDKFINRDNSGNDKMKSMEDSMDMWANEGQLADTVNFFFKVTTLEDGRESYEMLPTGTRNLIPAFWHRFRRYKGPGDFLSGMSFVQFKDALTCSQKYMETMDETWLTRLLATLYSGSKYRIEDVDRRAKRLTGVDIGIKYMSFCWLMGCMYNLRTDGDGEGIEIDGSLCRFSLIFNGKGGSDDGIGLLGVLMTLAESGVFGNIKETADADVWDVLARLYQLKLQEIEMKRDTIKN